MCIFFKKAKVIFISIFFAFALWSIFSISGGIYAIIYNFKYVGDYQILLVWALDLIYLAFYLLMAISVFVVIDLKTLRGAIIAYSSMRVLLYFVTLINQITMYDSIKDFLMQLAISSAFSIFVFACTFTGVFMILPYCVKRKEVNKIDVQ